MKVANIRLGHASNSSSTHSILILPPGMSVPNNPAYGEYGWQDFTLTEVDDKMDYYAEMLRTRLKLPEWILDDAIKAITGRAPSGGIVDHQSVWSLPLNFNGQLNEAFARELAEYFRREDVVILGGNDNSPGHPLAQQAETEGWEVHELRHILDPAAQVARKDGDWWVLYDRSTGTKCTFSFLENPFPYESQRPKSPELVDLKINQYCPFGCKFCSQSSTSEGGFADLRLHGYKVARQLADAQVFEVALGGGEPTLHPNLISFVKDLNLLNINVGITTRSLAWIRNLDPDTAKMFSCIAFSCHSVDEVVKVSQALNPRVRNTVDLRLHVVVGSMPKEEILAILERAKSHRMDVLLLGYKPVGFGKDFEVHDMTGLYNDVMEICSPNDLRTYYSRWPRIAIDTQLAASWGPKLKEAGLDVMFYESEGSRSAYWDLMAGELRPSSYAPAELSVPLPMNGDFPEAWSTMDVYHPEPHLDSV